MGRIRNEYIKGRWNHGLEIQPERPKWRGHVPRRDGGLVEGCKLGGRAKGIFVVVVREDMKLVGTGG